MEDAAYFSASPLPLSSSRWPSSVFGMSSPLKISAVPMPVPSVVAMTRPSWPFARRTAARQDRGVSVVHHGDRTTASFGEHFGDVHANPRLVQIGHVAELLANMNRSGECDADRSGLRNLKMLELLANDFANGLRSGNLRGEDLQTRFSKFALLEVNRGGLNAGATNVNAECLCSLNHLQPLYQGMLWVYSNRYVLW